MPISFTRMSNDSLCVNGTQKYDDSNNLILYYEESHILNIPSSNSKDLCKDLYDIKLYKYFSLKNLEHLIKDKMLFIERVESWDDSYENFFLKCNFDFDNMHVSAKSLIPDIFGQSWTTKKESDAMWRIYSNDKTGIKIKTNALELFKALYIDDSCMASTWFGKVRYNLMENFKTELLTRIKNHHSYEVFRDIFPETEFMKREEFEHEEEFRVIITLDSEQTETYKECKRLAYKININDFIEEYCLDPRLNDYEFKRRKEELISKGIEANKIIKSELYNFIPFHFYLND